MISAEYICKVTLTFDENPKFQEGTNNNVCGFTPLSTIQSEIKVYFVKENVDFSAYFLHIIKITLIPLKLNNFRRKNNNITQKNVT